MYEKTLDYVFPFGKYKGDELGDIAQSDPDYVQWCINTIKNFDVDDEVQELIEMYHDDYNA
jgi:uncharacterized protein (DUF3820 family)